MKLIFLDNIVEFSLCAVRTLNVVGCTAAKTK